MMKITVIILTKNEERHIERAIRSVLAISTRVVIVDCGSTDRTIEIARQYGAEVMTNKWVNHATQFNWAISQLPKDTEWIFRLDADEFVTDRLSEEIKQNLVSVPADIAGVYISRRMTFLGRLIRWGGVFPIRVLRIFRYGRGRCENRWMDEHVRVDGEAVDFKGEIIDDNLNSLTWWTEKHNAYASREVVDLLNLKFGFMTHETVADIRSGRQVSVKRWIKEHIYARLPGGFRAVMYFFYRYICRLGFLDGREGAAFHILQGFWYRYLVDMKLQEVTAYIEQNRVDAPEAIRAILGIDVTGSHTLER